MRKDIKDTGDLKRGAAACILTAVLLVLVFANPFQKVDKAEIVSSDLNIVREEIEETPSFMEIDLGDIALTDLTRSVGNFPEDGSDDFLGNMLCATFKNQTDKMLQYALIHVTIDDVLYEFEISTIPGNEMVHAFEKNRKEAPENMETITATAEHIVFFETVPSKCEETVKIEIEDNMLYVTNISEKDIDSEVSVFFKNKQNDYFVGGITYRLRMQGVKAGETVQGYSTHLNTDMTQIMFVTYGN